MDSYDPLIPPDPEEWLALDEHERIILVEDYHRDAKIDLPDITVHAIVHAVIEAQIAMGDELPVRRTIERLMAEGLDRHEAIHAAATVLAEHMYDILNQSEAAAPAEMNKAYFAAFERLTAESWRKY